MVSEVFNTTDHGEFILRKLYECAQSYFEHVYSIYKEAPFDTDVIDLRLFDFELETILEELHEPNAKQDIKNILNDSLKLFTTVFDRLSENEVDSIINNFDFILFLNDAVKSKEDGYTIFVYSNLNLVVSVRSALDQLIIRDNKVIFEPDLVKLYVN